MPSQTTSGFATLIQTELELRTFRSTSGEHRCMTCCPELRPKLTDEEREKLAAWNCYVKAEDAKAAAKGGTNLWHPPAEIRALKAKASWSDDEEYEIPEFLRDKKAARPPIADTGVDYSDFL